jgi:hypothetical protein
MAWQTGKKFNRGLYLRRGEVISYVWDALSRSWVGMEDVG